MYSYEQLHYVKAKFAVPAFAMACCSTDSKQRPHKLLPMDEWLTFVVNCEPRVSMYLKSIN